MPARIVATARTARRCPSRARGNSIRTARCAPSTPRAVAVVAVAVVVVAACMHVAKCSLILRRIQRTHARATDDDGDGIGARR